jgi:integrase
MPTATASDKSNVVSLQAVRRKDRGNTFRFNPQNIKQAVTRLMRLDVPFMLRDTDVPGLCLRRQTGDRMSFLVEKRWQKRLYRVAIAGWHPLMSAADIEQVRIEARAIINQVKTGTYAATVAAARAAKAAGVDELRTMTITKATEAYIAAAQPPLRSRTEEGYRLAAKRAAAAGKLADTPLVDWTPDDVRAAYNALVTETSAQSASGYMRCLRAVVNGWRDRFPEASTPINVIVTGMRASGKSRWVNADPRNRSLLAREIKPFLDACAVMASQADDRHAGVFRLLGLLCLTGMRFTEGAALRWSEVNIDRGMLSLPDTRMKGKTAFSKPLGRRAVELLRAQQKISGSGAFVFPSANKAGDHIDDVRYAMALVCRTAGCTEITPHDLRRTFLRAAEACGLPASRIKALVHHAAGGDVTAGYIGWGFADAIDDAAQRVEDFMLEARS